MSYPPPYLFPERPRYREPHPVRPTAVFAGAGAAALWFLLFGVVWGGVSGYAWLTILASLLAALTALALALRGDRGVAVGVALICGIALAATGVVVTGNWLAGHWILW